MLDIQGVEDFHGDMDFKVGGTRRGITAIQMDIKVDGLTYDIVAEALEKVPQGPPVHSGRDHQTPSSVSAQSFPGYAPKMFRGNVPLTRSRTSSVRAVYYFVEMCANF